MITSLSVNRGGLGRFGNQLFTIAGTIGIAISNGQPFGFPQWINRDAANFGCSADYMDQYFVNPLPEIVEGVIFQDAPYHWEIKEYNLPTGSWNICSHLQSEKYFKNYINTVRHYLTMKDEPKQNDYVAIHYRAGDYIADSEAYHPRCSKEYYESAMALFPGAKFMVFSDDIEEAKNIINNENATFVNSDYISDFRLMKTCKSFITANSSFSHMAALLGSHPEKKIVMPLRWFGKKANGLSLEGQYPEGSIIL